MTLLGTNTTRIISLVVLLLSPICVVYGLPPATSTLNGLVVGPGVTDHGNPSILCTPASWTDIITFMIANFFAHAATTIPGPGDSRLQKCIRVAKSLVFPTSGAMAGAISISRFSQWRSNDPLIRACRAGALCMVARAEEWQPMEGETFVAKRFPIIDDTSNPDAKEGYDASWSTKLKLQYLFLQGFMFFFVRKHIVKENELPKVAVTKKEAEGAVDTEPKPSNRAYMINFSRTSTFDQDYDRTYLNQSTRVHGTHALPPGYRFVYVPWNAIVTTECADVSDDMIDLASGYSLTKALIACFQVVYASITLYQTTDDQLREYGYAAYSLTVAQYAVMSFVNLIGNLLTANYETCYLVRNTIMDEVEKRTGRKFSGLVGRVVTAEEKNEDEFELICEKRGLAREVNSTDVWQYNEPHPYVMSDPPDLIRKVPIEAPCEVCTIMIATWRLRVRPDIDVLLVPICTEISTGPDDSKWLDLISWFATFLPSVASIAIIGGLSHFHKAQSAVLDRVFTMGWLASGLVWGFLTFMLASLADDGGIRARWQSISIPFAVFAVGGFVVVGRQILETGNCISLV